MVHNKHCIYRTIFKGNANGFTHHLAFWWWWDTFFDLFHECKIMSQKLVRGNFLKPLLPKESLNPWCTYVVILMFWHVPDFDMTWSDLIKYTVLSCKSSKLLFFPVISSIFFELAGCLRFKCFFLTGGGQADWQAGQPDVWGKRRWDIQGALQQHVS